MYETGDSVDGKRIAVVRGLLIEGALTEPLRPNRFRLRLPGGWLVSAVWHSGTRSSVWDGKGRTIMAEFGQDLSGAEDPVRSPDASLAAWHGTTDDAFPPVDERMWWRFPGGDLTLHRATPQVFFQFVRHLEARPPLALARLQSFHPVFGDGWRTTA